jgi:hypothetical protein
MTRMRFENHGAKKQKQPAANPSYFTLTSHFIFEFENGLDL